jgi:hypothetical protein
MMKMKPKTPAWVVFFCIVEKGELFVQTLSMKDLNYVTKRLFQILEDFYSQAFRIRKTKWKY